MTAKKIFRNKTGKIQFLSKHTEHTHTHHTHTHASKINIFTIFYIFYLCIWLQIIKKHHFANKIRKCALNYKREKKIFRVFAALFSYQSPFGVMMLSHKLFTNILNGFVYIATCGCVCCCCVCANVCIIYIFSAYLIIKSLCLFWLFFGCCLPIQSKRAQTTTTICLKKNTCALLLLLPSPIPLQLIPCRAIFIICMHVSQA